MTAVPYPALLQPERVNLTLPLQHSASPNHPSYPPPPQRRSVQDVENSDTCRLSFVPCPALLRPAKVALTIPEEMLASRGIETNYETIRCWALKFGRLFARKPSPIQTTADRPLAP